MDHLHADDSWPSSPTWHRLLLAVAQELHALQDLVGVLDARDGGRSDERLERCALAASELGLLRALSVREVTLSWGWSSDVSLRALARAAPPPVAARLESLRGALVDVTLLLRGIAAGDPAVAHLTRHASGQGLGRFLDLESAER